MENINFKKAHIAPCGINCGKCIDYLNDKCDCCKNIDNNIIKCNIKNCESLRTKYCFNCKKYPCDVLIRLDRNQKEKNGVSIISNLDRIKKRGITKHLETETRRAKKK